MSETPSKIDPRPAPADKCPKWAHELIEQIGALEIRLGNVRPSGDWKAATLQDVYKRLAEGADSFDDSVVETLFQKVSQGLTQEGFGAADIAAFINVRIPSDRLPYCSAAEVAEALVQTEH